MNELLKEERFNFISNDNKAFMLAFDQAMNNLGYSFGDKIGSGICWGKYMVIYTKKGVKSKKVYARIYIRDTNIALRLFFSGIEKHRNYIEGAPAHIKEVFVGDAGNCHHCKNEVDGKCKFRKTYTIDDRIIEKCNGETFEFRNPSVQNLKDYLALFTEFYSSKRKSGLVAK